MTASRDITKDNPTMAASFLEKIISKLHEEGRYPKGLFDSPLSPVCCNKQPIHPFIHSFNHSFIVHLSILYHSLLSCCYLCTLSLNRHRLQTVFGGLHGRYLNASLASSTLKAVLLHRIFLLVLSLIRRNLDVIGVRQRPLIGSPQILRDQRRSRASLP